MRRRRMVLATAGILLMLFGAFRLLTQVPISSVLLLGGWLVAAVIVHDGVLSPLVLAVGALLARVPPRARRSIQSGLIVGAILTAVAVPLILRRNSQPAVKALLLRDYGGNLGLLLGIVAVVSLGHYAVRVALQSRS